MIRRASISFILAVNLILLAACGSSPPLLATPTATPLPPDEPPADALPSDPAGPPADSPTATLEATFSGDGPWEVTFTTSDGVTLYGNVYGQSDQAIILAPMYPGEQAGWQPFAQALAAQGFRALTFDFRGYGSSGGSREAANAPADLAAAIAFLRENETGSIMLIGAGMGGLAAIRVTSRDGQIAGIAILSSPRAFEGLEVSDADLSALIVPSLWIATRNDMSQRVEEMFDLAGGTDKQVWIYEGSSLPGTYIFEGADRADLERRLIEFAARIFGR